MGGLANAFDLKDEAQAKEYLNTVGIEYRFQCFHEKRPDGCHRLADFLEAFRQDFSKARNVYQANCDDTNYGQSCFKYGIYCLVGRAGDKDPAQARDYFSKSCANGYGPGCNNAALMEQLGKVDGKKNFVKAAEYLQKGCDLNDVSSCQLLSTFLITGKDGLPKDMSRAFSLALKSCEMGHMYACANLSQMYKKGDGTEQNLELAEKYKARAKELHKSVTQPERGIEFSK